MVLVTQGCKLSSCSPTLLDVQALWLAAGDHTVTTVAAFVTTDPQSNGAK